MYGIGKAKALSKSRALQQGTMCTDIVGILMLESQSHTCLSSAVFQHACVGLATGLRGQLALMLRCVAVGKTSLMSALAGKASYGTVTGSITINGKPDKLLRYKRVMGFVPQVSCTD